MPLTLLLCMQALFGCHVGAIRVNIKMNLSKDENFNSGPEYTPIDDLKPTLECGTEYFFETPEHSSLADLVKTAHNWCRADSVPADKRVPEFLRGLYWMKDLDLPDIAFCPSLAEWTKKPGGGAVAKLAVWTHFVFRKAKGEDVSSLAANVAAIPVLGGPLIYTIDFPDDTFDAASITTNSWLMNRFIKFPLRAFKKGEATPDGQVVSKKKGDVWDRPSFFGFGVFSDWFKFEYKRLGIMQSVSGRMMALMLARSIKTYTTK
mmetsp:Transcript_45476/g.71917  ORF Transcript_45476/g.71917 Transcript_45476/m.71917 type:complete len:262 (-) Transcript_45476:135-920(-)